MPRPLWPKAHRLRVCGQHKPFRTKLDHSLRTEPSHPIRQVCESVASIYLWPLASSSDNQASIQ
jgi:hypothetical protein